mgnify:CR=1 FL=1
MISIIFRTSTWEDGVFLRPHRLDAVVAITRASTRRVRVSTQARLPQFYQGRPERNEPAALGGVGRARLWGPRRRHAARDGFGRTSWSSEALAVPKRADSPKEAPRRAEGVMVDGVAPYFRVAGAARVSCMTFAAARTRCCRMTGESLGSAGSRSRACASSNLKY